MRKLYTKPKNKKKQVQRIRKPWSFLEGFRKSKNSCFKKRPFNSLEATENLSLKYGQYAYFCSRCGK